MKEILENDYMEFLKTKTHIINPAGFECKCINEKLFQFQRDIVMWALKKGKAAIFAGTGLGKTIMQVEWASKVCEHTGGNVLIVAPLAVSKQTIREGLMIDRVVNLAACDDDIKPGINITNYEKLDNFKNLDRFDGVVLDESSILKSFTGKIKQKIIDTFAYTPYKLACTATPSPNDYMELGNHAEFLGVMKRNEMLSMYFVHDGGNTSKWRIKRHAVGLFWEWVASWAVMLTTPADLGYDNDGYDLPPLRIHQVTVETDMEKKDTLTLSERQKARRETIKMRADKCASIINDDDNNWIIWCNLNDESSALHQLINDSVEVKGSDKDSFKEQAMLDFSAGKIKKLVTKPSICGFGMNWQHCHKMAFVGLSDSFEQYYQAVRRCWRFGQDYPVDVYIITADVEGAVKANIERKEQAFEEMLHGMISATQEITKANVRQTERNVHKYNPNERMILPSWIASNNTQEKNTPSTTETLAS